MPSRLLPYAFLLLLGVVTTLASLQDLRYNYQDLLPDPPSDDISLKEIANLWKTSAKNVEAYAASLSRRGRKELERRELERVSKLKGSQEILRDDILGVYSKRRPSHPFNYPAPQLGDILEEANARREYAARNPINVYPNLNPSNHILHGYPGFNGALKDSKARQSPEYPTSGYRFHNQEVIERGMKEEPSYDFGGRYHSLDRQNPEHRFSGSGAADDGEEPVQDFTYKIDTTSPRRQELKFAVAPPDERFYRDGPLNEDDHNSDERTDQGLAYEEVTDQPSLGKFETVPEPQNQESENSVVSEAKRRAETQNPVVFAVADHKISNDIYFVAVVAGCSAAAMFILVLISLTWCRLQRGAKAAADVEYPAYGVTGPNKDTSPSGDRRLAQSAQMYHYQHQKQQIIAMERYDDAHVIFNSRTASGRDPGSVSEAESDEENEEGDYTVYECPGLAPTGEMEVKNPLFHDDPTPATPASQSQNKPEDHM